MPRRKTEIGVYEADEKKPESKVKEDKEQSPVVWEKLQPKPQDGFDVKTPIVLGKGKASGTKENKKLYTLQCC